ncbi:MAG: FkbM family methyltransferase [Rhodospirillales bacterium]|nr:FkbM family methyltransferase [Rhodospirillales bacterium]
MISAVDYEVPVIHGYGLDHLEGCQTDLRAALEKVLAFRTGAVIDVGANIGELLAILLQVDRDVTYIGIEPNLQAAYYLEHFIQANGLPHHFVLATALGAAQTVAEFSYNDDMDVSGTIAEGYRPVGMYKRHKKVLVERGDDLLKSVGLDAISLIKIDAEGCEVEVLNGLQATIDAYRPFLILEVTPYGHFESGDLNQEYFGEVSAEERRSIVITRKKFNADLDAFMAHHGYAAMKMLKSGDLEPVTSVDQVSTTDFFSLNYLAVPRESLADFTAKYMVHPQAAE